MILSSRIRCSSEPVVFIVFRQTLFSVNLELNMIKKAFVLLALIGFTLYTSGLPATSSAKYRFRKNSISERDLLNVASKWQHLKGQSLLPMVQPAQPAAEDTVKLNILAIRVEFQEDTDDATTGNGKFDLSAPKSLMIDPPPHNRPYFEAQLQAVANYYKKVSNRKLILKGYLNPYGDVYPLEANKAYQLPRDMVYYGTDESQALRDKRLIELFRDAWTVADETDQIDFNQYDCFVVFHAGVGADFAFDFDETPLDISSAFLSFTDLKQNFGQEEPDYQGIAVQNGRFHIKDGIILPETQSQDELELGLLGTAVLMFGSQMGLPSLFNTETGHSGIGKWGLMDQGSGNHFGLIPAQPCAWTKVFMGWESVQTIRRGERVPVAAVLAKNPHKIYKVPINAHEYFLIENRQRRFPRNAPDLAVAYDQNGVRVELQRDGSMTQSADADTFKVLVNVNNYDFDCPGSGILIWHIDESIIAEKYATNSINNDPLRRGVDLEEAHGSQDIGGNYGFLHPASGSENGIAENAFWKDNESFKTVNNTDYVAFTPATNPASWSNSRANSHIYVTNFSDIDSVMFFDLRIDFYQSGFPQTIGKNSRLTPNSLLLTDFDGNGTIEIITTSTDGKIYGWNSDGSKLISNNYQESQTDFSGKVDTLSIARFATVNDSINKAPTVADLDGDNQPEVIVVTQAGFLFAWHASDDDGDGLADLMPLFPIQLEETPTTVPMTLSHPDGSEMVVVGLASGAIVAVGKEGVLWQENVSAASIQGFAVVDMGQPAQFVATTANGEIVLLNSEIKSERKIIASEVGVAPGQPVCGDVDADATVDIIIPFADGTIRFFDLEGKKIFQFNLSNPAKLAELALCDLNHDGYLEIVGVFEDQLTVFTHQGVLFENFPVDLEWTQSSSLFNYAVPAIGDYNNDSFMEIILGAANGDVLAYDFTGAVNPFFPLTTGGAIYSTPALSDLDQDGDVELVAIADDNHLYVWNFISEFHPENISWGTYRGNSRRQAFASSSSQPAPEVKDLIASAYNYPNPTEGTETTIRYTLTAAAVVEIKIFDLAGALIDKLTGKAQPHLPGEIIWNLQNIESGVYFARIQATTTATNQAAEKIIKIAVVK